MEAAESLVSKPHGGSLVVRVAKGARLQRLLIESREMHRIYVDEDHALDLENIGHGIYSPLTGFLCRDELESVLYEMRLLNGLPWTIPIVLDVSKEDLGELREGDEAALFFSETPLAVLRVEEVYPWDRGEYAEKVFKTRDANHPGVAKLYSAKELLIGGEIELIGEAPNPFYRYTLRPIETRVLFRERGWRTVVGFQTRNAPHLGHEYLQKSALAFVDGLFINPVIGRKKRGDFRDEVILRAYDVLTKNYFPKDTVVLSILRYQMRYAGPREAVHHAIMRKNFGCTHFIVGRDHAGVGNYYGPYEAQEIFKQFPDLGIVPLFFREFLYCEKCGGIVNEKICPHSEELRVRFSGTKLRELISRRERPPPYMVRPEVAEVLLSYEKPFVE